MANITENITEIMEAMENKKKKNNRIYIILCAVFLIGAVVAGTVFIVKTINGGKAQKQYEQLAENTGTTESTVEETMESTEVVETPETVEETVEEPDPLQVLMDMGVPIPEKTIDFADLQANTNEDIYAWIYIPDSMIDYPVLQHPTDNSYYLNYNIDGSKGRPGCIYTENYNTKDFTDPNTVLYGHNMRVGTMFADLHKFEDIEYFEATPYVYIYTPEKLLVYKVFAAYETDNRHVLYGRDFTDQATFQVYLDDIYETRSMNCNLREDVEVTTDDKIITLSTCVTGKADKRYLVQGVLLNEN